MPLVTLILFGALSASFALLVEVVLLSLGARSSLAPLQFNGFFTLLLVAVIEEGSKYVFLRQYARRFLLVESLDLKTALTCGLLFGLGFALPEVALSSQFLASSILPLLGILGLHLTTSILLGAVIFRHKGVSLSKILPILGVVITLHLLYNLAISRFI